MTIRVQALLVTELDAHPFVRRLCQHADVGDILAPSVSKINSTPSGRGSIERTFSPRLMDSPVCSRKAGVTYGWAKYSVPDSTRLKGISSYSGTPS